MKLITAVLLVCLLVTGTVSAVSMNVGPAQVAKTVVPVSAQITRIPGAIVPVTIVTQGGHGMLEVYSDPSGATITINGNSNPVDKTPLKYSLPAGSYTVVVSLTGYQDYTETFYLEAGAIKDINADLKPKISVPLVAQAGITRVQVSGTRTLVTLLPPVTLVPGAAVTRSPVYDCDEMVYPGYTCMLLSDAQQSFGSGWTYFVDKPCGYQTVNNIMYTKYCCKGEPKGTIQRTAVQANITLSPVPGLKVVSNRTRFFEPNHTLVPVPRGTVVARQKDFISSFFGMFSGLFGKKTCPAGQLSCDDTCVDPASDPQNCGKCQMTCNTNFTCCNGECADLQGDSENCGTCGMTCFAPAFCCAGSCEEWCEDMSLNYQPGAGLL